MEYKLIRSKRKTIELSIGDDLVPLVKAPLRMSEKDIESFVLKHEKWIIKQTEAKKDDLIRFSISPEKEKEIRAKALPYLTEKTKFFASKMGVKLTDIKITSAEKRFGSCSGKNSICYSWRLMLYPEEAIDYVVVHELAHIVHKNHGKEFYKLIEKFLPDYKNREKLLK